MGSCNIFVTFSTFLLLTASILFVVISGVAYGYMNNSIVFSTGKINFKVLFGCGIGFGFLFFMFVWIYLSNPQFCCHFVLSIPLILMMLILYLVFSAPRSASKYVRNLGEKWDNSTSIIEYQYKFRCCGWVDENDRGLVNCPFDFESGCRKMLDDYITSRFHEVMVTTSVMLSFFVVSIVFITIFSCDSNNNESMYDYIFPLSEL